MKFRTLFLLVPLLCSVLSYADPAPNPVSGLVPEALLKASHDIPKFYAVDSGRVYRGAKPNSEDLKTLKAAGFRTIIDLQGGDFDIFGSIAGYPEPGELPQAIQQEKINTIKSQMNWVSERMSSFAVSPSEQLNIAEALAIMHDPNMQPVFVHCQYGKDRTGLVAALYEVLFMSESFLKAHKNWVELGHNGDVDRAATFALDEYFYISILNPDSALRRYFSL